MIHLSIEQSQELKAILVQQGFSGQVFAFGSRVRGDHQKYSDLDLLIKSDQQISIQALQRLQSAFQESNLPFRVDIVDWWTISADFRSRIQPELEAV